MAKWNQLDKALISYGWPKNLDKTLKRIAIIFLSLEAGNYLYRLSLKSFTKQCKLNLKKKISIRLKKLFL